MASVTERITELEAELARLKAVAASNSEDGAIRVAVHGAGGRLGSLITKQLTSGGDSKASFAGSVGRDAVIPENTNVIVDVTLPVGTKALLRKLIDSGSTIPVVIGTTGEIPMDEIREYGKQAAVAIVPNFSIGIPLVTKLAQMAVKALPAGWNVEMTETHHTRKLDAPSGTGKKLVNAMKATNAPVLEGKEIRCNDLRLGDVFGEHTIHLAGPGERVEIIHRATRREVFAIGAVRSSVLIADKQPGVYDELNY
jgi:4-hydroxy-tetrahydrodipicolinate reductase|eukprot:g8649.t1